MTTVSIINTSAQTSCNFEADERDSCDRIVNAMMLCWYQDDGVVILNNYTYEVMLFGNFGSPELNKEIKDFFDSLPNGDA